MKPDEVPDDLIALLRNGHHVPGPGASAEDWARCILANVLPEHERQVREEIASAYEDGPQLTNDEMADLRACWHTDPEHERCIEVWIRYGIRIARGEP